MDGDRDAIRALWHRHRRWVAAVLLAHMPSDAELEDLLQEVAMTLVRHVHTLKDPGAVRPWLRSVSVNLARTAGRRRQVRRRVETPVRADAPGVEAWEDPRGRGAAVEEGQRALRLARELPEAYREPLLLRAVRGLTYRQIADALDVPVTTVETRLVRARRMLRELMAQGDDVAQERVP